METSLGSPTRINQNSPLVTAQDSSFNVFAIILCFPILPMSPPSDIKLRA